MCNVTSMVARLRRKTRKIDVCGERSVYSETKLDGKRDTDLPRGAEAADTERPLDKKVSKGTQHHIKGS